MRDISSVLMMSATGLQFVAEMETQADLSPSAEDSNDESVTEDSVLPVIVGADDARTSENERKPWLEVGRHDDAAGPPEKKRRLETEVIGGTESVKDTATEAGSVSGEIETPSEPETAWRSGETAGQLSGHRYEIIDLTTEQSDDTAGQSGGGVAAAVKKPRLISPSRRVTYQAADEHCDRGRRNKSTSAAVLLGLVKSRVRKLAAERHDAAAASPTSSATASASSSSLISADADSPAAVASLKEVHAPSAMLSAPRTPRSSYSGGTLSDWIKPFNLGILHCSV